MYPFNMSLVALIYECTKVKYASSDEFKFEIIFGVGVVGVGVVGVGFEFKF
jgi:hypothetical protein